MNTQDFDPATVLRIQRRVFPDEPAQWDGDFGNATLAAVDRYLAIGHEAPAPPAPPHVSNGVTFVDELIRLAGLEVGTHEVGGNNRGQRVQEYQRATEEDGTGWAWCAAFQCWLILRALEKHPMKFKRPTTAAAWGFEDWAREQKANGVQLFKPRGTIRRGDIVMFTFSHIGLAIADEKSDGTVQTIEGNTNGAGSPEGDGVFKKTRRTDQIRSHVRITG